jgi:hypothetical protein
MIESQEDEHFLEIQYFKQIITYTANPYKITH